MRINSRKSCRLYGMILDVWYVKIKAFCNAFGYVDKRGNLNKVDEIHPTNSYHYII